MHFVVLNETFDVMEGVCAVTRSWMLSCFVVDACKPLLQTFHCANCPYLRTYWVSGW